jgi:hypothetical protein
VHHRSPQSETTTVAAAMSCSIPVYGTAKSRDVGEALIGEEIAIE